MTDHPIFIISGTNRPGSNSLRVANLVAQKYEAAGLPHEVLDLAQLPTEVFTPEIYSAKPASFQLIQQKVVQAAGLHVITPEYNGSFPGILKYFIDLLKFPESFEHKPVAFIGLAAGMFGALRAVEQLQMIFAYRNAHLFPDRVFLPAVQKLLGPSGQLLDAELEKRLSRQVESFARFAKVMHESKGFK